MKSAVLFFMITLISISSMSARDLINLGGSWQVALDPSGVGAEQQWFARDLAKPTNIALPGSVQKARLGDPVTLDTKWTANLLDSSYYTAARYAPYRQPGNIKIPFWLQPDTHYTGAAWYQRDIEVPASWKGKRILLSLERPHWKTTVWLDDHMLGTNDSICTPHVFDLGEQATTGKHRLTVCVDNTHCPDIGESSHSITDHTQGNWNGIVGRMELIATEPIWIEDLQVFPKAADRSVRVEGRVQHFAGSALPAEVNLSVDGDSRTTTAKIARNGTFSTTLTLGSAAALWDEFNPALHRLVVSVAGGEHRELKFGLRDFVADGRQLKINGRPVFLRGTLDCAVYPRTGHPPMDVATWREVFKTIKAYGLNHVRYHSWCPPEEAFVAADELGVYLQVEVNTWPTYSVTLGDGLPIDDWVDRETARILRTYGNHPSFVLFCSGNEPSGPKHPQWLSQWVTRQKQADPRRLHSSSAGWPELPENEFHVTPDPRIQHWEEGLRSRINARPPETVTDYSDFIYSRTVPVVSHEIGQWCAYPDFSEISKYTGYLKPKKLDIFRATLETHGMGAQARDFLTASGKLQTLCYKEDIESALRTPEMGGFQLLGLSDFPGQGTAPVGVLDAFWETKGYITPDDFRRFCNNTVPLALLEKRIFTADEHLVVRAKVAHYGVSPVDAAGWQLLADNGLVVAKGDLSTQHASTGNVRDLGQIDIPLAELIAPAHYKLVIFVRTSGANEEFKNDWDVWVYPRATDVVTTVPDNVMLAHSFSASVQKTLEAGGTVVLMIPPGKVAPDPESGPIAFGFSSIFWNTSWTNRQAPHTLGILCDPESPALTEFPTDPWSNWQWWYPLTNAAPMIIDQLPRDIAPTVQAIDDWFTNRKLALVFEARVGRGKLLVTSINLSDIVLDPVRRQLRASLLAYAASPKFQPTTLITPDQIQSLFAR